MTNNTAGRGRIAGYHRAPQPAQTLDVRLFAEMLRESAGKRDDRLQADA